MENLLKRWKLLAQKYKRESFKIQEKVLEALIPMVEEEIHGLALGFAIIFFFVNTISFYLGSLMIKLDSIVLQTHEKFEEALDKILLAHEEDDDEDEEMDSGFAEDENEEMDEN